MIDVRTLETILSDQMEELEARLRETLCHRPEESLVEINSPQAQVVIGVRRSGKSTLCYQALQSKGVKFAYADFDDERLNGLQAEQLNDVLSVLYKIYGDFQHLFLDEVQNIDGWHLFVNRLLRHKMHIIITGSNAKLLSGELATHLTGRNKEIALYPFSFHEFCLMKGVDTTKLSTKAQAFRRAAFDEYMQQGGFPELLIIEDKRHYVNTLVDNILKRDIEQRFKIAYKAAFQQMTHHLLNIVPTIPNISELTDLFQFKSEHTTKNYIDHLKQAYMLIGVPKYATKSKLRMVQEKLYAVDVAMMNMRDNALSAENVGWRLETIVLIQLLRKCKLNGWDVYFLRERSGECDFLVCKGSQVLQAVQVSYDISAEKTRKRELKGLAIAAQITGCKDLLLLTDHEYENTEYEGLSIKIRPVTEWQ